MVRNAGEVGSVTERSGWRLAVLVLVAATLLRLALAAVVPLFPDEAYYWVWSARPAGGYYDHPPVVAFLIGLGGWTGTPLGIRLGPVMAGFVLTLATAGIARRIGGDRAALRAAVMISCVPVIAVGLILASPDVPLLAATAVGLYAVVRAIEHPAGARAGLWWWLLAGVALGIALCSKYTAFVLAGGVFLGLLSSPSLRQHLRAPGPWVAIMVAAVVFLPVVAWNAEHSWASFHFQFRHGLKPPKIPGPIGVLRREADYLGAMMGLASPILFVLFVLATARGLTRRATGAQRLLAVVATVTVLFFAYSALRQRVEPNWPAPAYGPAIILIATLPWSVRAVRWTRAGVVVGAAMSLLICVHAIVPILPIRPSRDPIRRSAGWDAVAMAVERTRTDLSRSSTARTWVAGNRYQDAALLSFYDQGIRAFAVNIGGRRNQYDLWPGFNSLASPGDRLVLILDDTPETPVPIAALGPYFHAVRRGERVAMRWRDDEVGNRRLWVLEGWKGGWPPRPQWAPPDRFRVTRTAAGVSGP
ncbi:MAG TPA: glycosyltransferase family 39 protein [Gemmatimonadales bacterium]|nr:glycosyltransferase family 39 protein [Gemmatimonadales bacterium]